MGEWELPDCQGFNELNSRMDKDRPNPEHFCCFLSNTDNRCYRADAAESDRLNTKCSKAGDFFMTNMLYLHT